MKTKKDNNYANDENIGLINCIDRLENYNTLFDIETLFFILHDQMEKCNEQLLKGYDNDAKNTLNKMFSMFWVIKDKLPNSLFEDIEHVTHYLKYQNTSGHKH